MKIIRSIITSIKTLTRFERILWGVSAAVIFLSLIATGDPDILVMCATLVGISALIFIARGDVLGQILIIIFSLLYAGVSYRFAYYGEMISYVGMSGLIALFSTVSWIRHPYKEKQVKISRPDKKTLIILAVLTAAVTCAFYFILKVLGTSNLPFSTISIATSFVASSLALLRSPHYALAYAANDIVLIILWIFAAIQDISSLPMIVCFGVFFINDMYGFFNWLRMEKLQKKAVE
ncbi:MAG: nicotinamide mononucleotide transporter [Clostridia bacterium]|nr:nicotinamide mononucleotide transporter [Clostridia bacterium]